MPGTTPVYGFPYPEPTDLVADYPALGQQLAEDIEDALPTIGGLSPVAPSTVANSGGTATLSGNTVTFAGVSTVSLNGCFTTSFDHYRLLISAATASGNANMQMRFRAAGTDNSTSNYSNAVYRYNSTNNAAGDYAAENANFATVGQVRVLKVTFAVDLFAPERAEVTLGQLLHANAQNTSPYVTADFGAILFNATTQFDGFTLIPSASTISGTISVFGYKK